MRRRSNYFFHLAFTYFLAAVLLYSESHGFCISSCFTQVLGSELKSTHLLRATLIIYCSDPIREGSLKEWECICVEGRVRKGRGGGYCQFWLSSCLPL